MDDLFPNASDGGAVEGALHRHIRAGAHGDAAQQRYGACGIARSIVTMVLQYIPLWMSSRSRNIIAEQYVRQGFTPQKRFCETPGACVRPGYSYIGPASLR